MINSNDHASRWWGFLCLLLCTTLCIASGCERSNDSDQPDTRTARLAVPPHSSAPGLDIWISVSEGANAEKSVDLKSLKMAPLGNIAYLPLRECLGEHQHDWPNSHALTTEFELHAGKIQRGVADYTKVGDTEPKNWPLPDDTLDDDPPFVSCVAKGLAGSVPDRLKLDDKTHLRVRVGLQPKSR